jgi:peptidoglycan/xylan/chitin deacetylase (PgdA/CDA1 family)
VALTILPAIGISHVRAAGPTIVSLTFDDGRATQYAARSILSSHGMHATFYVNSGLLGSYSFWMNWQQVGDLAADGNEIGGHTAYHLNLTQIDSREAQRQICDDRANLLSHGYAATNFAYPYGAYNGTIEAMVQACGYASARSTNVINANGAGTPPADMYAFGIGNSGLSLGNLENAVTNVRNAGGGWVPLMFHDVCNGCSSLAISPADFATLLDWLQSQSASGVVVQTVQQVVGGAVQPPVTGPVAPAAPNGTNGLRNASLEVDANGDSAPDCWTVDGYGSNTYTWSRTADAHTGSFAEKVDITNYSSGERKLVVANDLGACTPTMTPGHRYVVKAWYKATRPAYFTAYVRNADLGFTYYTDSPNFAASSGWSQAVWTTPVIASGVRGISFGLAIAGNGSLTVDDLSIDDAAAAGGPDTTAPTVALTSPANGATLANQVTISATASDNLALDHVDYLVDGQAVGSTVDAPTTFSWNSRSVANGTHTFAARAFDTSGNSTTSASVSATVANQPLVNLLANNPSLEAGGNPPDCWQLGGSQTGSNSAVYTHTADSHTGSFAENLNMTSWTAGDRKLVTTQSQACAPAAIGGHAYAVTAWYKSTLNAWIYVYYRQAVTGSWIFLTQASRPAAAGWTQANFTTPALPADANKISVGMGLENVGSLTMDDFSISDAAPAPDTTAPTSTITCNNNGAEGTCGTGYYPGSVLIKLAATDDANGTGVASIRYTTDGSDPTASNGSTYSGPFGTTGTVKYRAYDFAGNAEAIHTQAILVDGTAPTTTIACNGAPCAATPYNAPVSVTLDASDASGSGVASTRYTTDGTDPGPTTGTLYAGAFIVDSTTTVKFASFDNVANAETIVTQVVGIDVTTPVVSITAPADGSPVGGSSVTISADATDDVAISSVDFLVDDTVVGTATTSPYSIAWDSTTVPGGAHSITARATDSAGNVTTSSAASISVDNVAPAISLTAPADGSSVTGTSVTISADPTDDVAVASVEFLVDGTVVGAATSAPWSTTWDSTTVADGPHAVRARVTDSAGNTTTSTAGSINVDNSGPSVSVGTPADGSMVTGVSVTISADPSDDAGIASVDFLVDGNVVGSATAAPWSISWDSRSVADGSHSITARATDTLGNATTSGPTGVTVDNSGPSAAISSPAAGATVSGTTLSISATATDPAGVASVEFLVDGNIIGTDSTAPYSISWDSTTVVDGSHDLTARATDSLGNVTTSAANGVTVDNSGPAVSLTAPADGSSVTGGSVTISADATDEGSGIAGVEFFVDGTSVGTDTTAPYSIGWDSTTVSDGSHDLTARATDSLGNSLGSNARTVTVDNSGPTVALTAPAASARITGTSSTISASASDSAGVSSVEFFVGATSIGIDTTAPYSITWNTTAVADGAVSIVARATDGLGNTADSAAVAATVDNTGPDITVSAPAAGARVAGTNVTISASASDGAGVAEVEFLVDGTVVGTDASAPYSVVWSSTTVVDGAHNITARATDGLGNVSTSAAGSVTVDNTGPATALTAPADGATVSGTTVTLSATATDGGGVTGVQFLVDGGVVGSDSTAPYSIAWNSTTVAEGSHTLAVRATDGFGNVATSTSSTVTVHNAPTVSLTAPADGATISGKAVTVSATASGGASITKVDFYAGATLLGTDTTAPYSIAWNSTKVTDGAYALTARATNSLGQATTSAARSVSVRNDPTPPTVSVSAPAAGAIVSGTSVAITATASDNVGVARVDFFVGATLVGSDTTSPYATTWNSTTVADGNVSITARATDVNGNIATSAVRTVTVRNAPVTASVANASLETDANSDGVPDCFAPGGSGNSTGSYARVADAHTGSFAERITVSGYKNGSRTFETVKDGGACAATVNAGRSYTLGLWYKSNAAISLVVSYRNSAGTWVSWVTSPTSPSSAAWAQKTFTTAAVPAGATNLSFGISVASNAIVTVDDYSIALVP